MTCNSLVVVLFCYSLLFAVVAFYAHVGVLHHYGNCDNDHQCCDFVFASQLHVIIVV